MSDQENLKALEDLEKSFRILESSPEQEFAADMKRKRDEEWKRDDPDGYRKDLERMCKEMFGDTWEIEYQAMLREEFPEQYE